jgi:hypothetical protein
LTGEKSPAFWPQNRYPDYLPIKSLLALQITTFSAFVQYVLKIIAWQAHTVTTISA